MDFYYYNFFLKKCKIIFLNKLKYYGLSWMIFNHYSILDQVLIKVIRIKNISLKGFISVQEEKLIDTYIDIINYLIFALIKIDLSSQEERISFHDTIHFYNEKKIEIQNIVQKIVFKKPVDLEKILNQIIYIKNNLKKIDHHQLKKRYLKVLVEIIFFCLQSEKHKTKKNRRLISNMKNNKFIEDKIIVGNWKMNHDLHETTNFLRNFIKIIFEKKIHHYKKIIIAPSYPFLHISNQIAQGTFLKIAAQNMHFMDKGSYTGEVSAYMLKSIGINTVIIGHSERRINFFEKEDILLKKIKLAIKYKLNIIFCLGETLKERNEKKHFSIIEKQLCKTIFYCSPNEIKQFYIAYEPIWAIGTGLNAEYSQIQEMHEFIREKFLKKYGQLIAKKIPILYGGSINHMNAKQILSNKYVDGGLVGNNSLKLEQFLKIVQA